MSEEWPTFPSSVEGATPFPEFPPGQTVVPGGYLSLPSRPLSATSQLRARQRADAAQQAVSELSVLTEQLLELPGRLDRARLATARGRQFVAAVESFADLASMAWRGMAEDTFEETTNSQAYRQLAVAAARRVSRLQQEAATPVASGNWRDLVGKKGRNAGPLTRWRMDRISAALARWRTALGVSEGRAPSMAALGRALEDVRSAVGWAGLDGGTLVLQRIVTLWPLIVGGIIGVLLIAAATGAFALKLDNASSLTVAAGFVALLWIAHLALFTGGRSLGARMGPARRRLMEGERHSVEGALAGWRWSALVIIGLSMVGGTALASYHLQSAGRAIISSSQLFAQGVRALASGDALATLVVLAGGLLIAPLLVTLPATLTYQAQLARDLAGSPRQMPHARRVMLPFALGALGVHTFVALSVTLVALALFGRLPGPLTRLGGVAITWQGVIIASVIFALYLAAVEVPFRAGMARWRAGRLAAIDTGKHELTAKLNRLAPEPEAATDDVTTMQYSVARLQYLRLQEDDARHESMGAFAPVATLFAALIVLIIAALAGDAIARFATLARF